MLNVIFILVIVILIIHFRNLPLIQFVVFKDEIPIASSLCLYRGNYLHMHFAISKTEYFKV